MVKLFIDVLLGMSGICKTRQFFYRSGEQLAGFKVQEDCGVASRVQFHCGQVPHLFPEYGNM